MPLFCEERFIKQNIFFELMPGKKLKEDTYNYKGWLNSDSFLKRAFAVFGYNLISILIIWGIIFGLVLISLLISALLGV